MPKIFENALQVTTSFHHKQILHIYSICRKPSSGIQMNNEKIQKENMKMNKQNVSSIL